MEVGGIVAALLTVTVVYEQEKALVTLYVMGKW